MHIYVPENDLVFLLVPKNSGTAAQMSFMFSNQLKEKRSIGYGINVKLEPSVDTWTKFNDSGWNKELELAATNDVYNRVTESLGNERRSMMTTWNDLQKVFPRINELNTYAISRNPWERAVSLWKYHMKQSNTEYPFQDFLNLMKIPRYRKGYRESRKQTDIVGPNTKILKYENLSVDWGKLQKVVNVRHIDKFISNVSEESPKSRDPNWWRKYYYRGTGTEAKLKNIVQNLYAEDIERFDYAY